MKRLLIVCLLVLSFSQTFADGRLHWRGEGDLSFWWFDGYVWSPASRQFVYLADYNYNGAIGWHVSWIAGLHQRYAVECDGVWYYQNGNSDTWIDTITYPDSGGEPPPADQINPDSEKADKGDPINFISGNSHFSVEEINIPTRGIPLTFTRYYNSAEVSSSSLGKGWRHSYDWNLALEPDKAVVTCDNANTYSFVRKTNGVYLASFDNNWQFSGPTNETYTLSLTGGIAYLFDTNGVLEKIADNWGNSVSMVYSNGLISSVEHSIGQSMEFAYSNGLLSVVTAATNLNVAFAYSTNGVLTNTICQAGSGQFTESYFYDSSLLITQRVNKVGTDFHYTYNTSTGKATGTYLADDHWYEHQFVYNGDTNCQVISYRNGETFTHSYDINRYITRVSEDRFESITGKVTYAYDSGGNETQKTAYDADTNHWTEISRLYDERHNVTNESFGLSAEPVNITHYTWHPEWQTLTSITDPEGFKTEFEYTNGAVALSRIYLSSNETAETTYSYTTNGLLAFVTNANEHVTAFTYDELGYPETITPAAGPVLTLGYDSFGHLTNSTMPGGDIVELGGDPVGRTTSYTVTPLGWVERIDYADDLYETFDYNALGKVTNHVDRAGRATTYSYLPGGKLQAVTRQFGSTNVTLSYDFDQQFNALVISDELDRAVESYKLDALDRVTSVTNVENQAMSISYLVENFVDSITRFDNSVVSNEYTSDGHLETIYYPDETNSYTYLKNGWLQTASDSSGMISNEYNHAGWLTSVSNDLSVAEYGYDPVGNLTNATVTLDSGTLSRAYTYDDAERLYTISTPLTNTTFGYMYNTNNGLVASINSMNLWAEYEYDVMDRVTEIDWKGDGGASVMRFNYQYTDAGMISSRTITKGGTSSPTTYQYDDLDRLTSVDEASSLVEYTYDFAGNRQTKTANECTVSYTKGTGNRLDSWTASSTNNFADSLRVRVEGYSSETIGTDDRWGELWVSNNIAVTPEVSGTNFWTDEFVAGVGTQQVVAAIRDEAGNMGYATNEVFLTVVTNGSYAYDAAGCLTNISYMGADYSKSLDLSWNSQYQLVSVDDASSFVSYTYDVLGRRTSCSVGSASQTNTTYFVYDGQQVVADLDESGNVLRSYVWGPGIDSLLALTAYGEQTNTYYAVKDHLNSVHALVDESGTIVESYQYDTWGRTTIIDAEGNELSESAIGNRYCFQGREYDWTTQLYYFRARWYDPITGRWLSKDPIGISGGLNLYAFCGNNPISFIDPLGLADITFIHPSGGNQYGKDKIPRGDDGIATTVSGHGDSSGNYVQNGPAHLNGTTAGQRAGPHIPEGEVVILYICNSGLGSFGQDFANASGHTTIAPNGYVTIDGRVYPTKEDLRNGTNQIHPSEAWSTFCPE